MYLGKATCYQKTHCGSGWRRHPEKKIDPIRDTEGERERKGGRARAPCVSDRPLTRRKSDAPGDVTGTGWAHEGGDGRRRANEGAHWGEGGLSSPISGVDTVMASGGRRTLTNRAGAGTNIMSEVTTVVDVILVLCDAFKKLCWSAGA